MIGILFLICGLILTVGMYHLHNWSDNRRGTLLAGYVLALGIVLCVVRYAALDARMEAFGALLGVGVLLMGCGVFNLRATGLCKEKTAALYRGVSPVGLGLAAPVYEYAVDGASYCCASADVLSGARVRELSANESAYIYVNAGQPGMFVVNAKTYVGDVLLLIMGVLLVYAAAFLLWL